ncbi:MAG: META domain-containing protein [Bacteroidales bacterium]|jgi:heat shock protein HslJ|nr:META domain-containing protein [Bacteroidales bacterium]
MKMTVITIMCAAAVLSASGCNTAKKTSTSSGYDATLQEMAGIYTGTLPCVDCPGIQVRINLNSNLTYTLQTRYEGTEETITEPGKYEWDAVGRIIKFDNELLGNCLPEGNTIYKLTDGKKNTGSNAENYKLAKVDRLLVEKYWKLLELYGNPVTSPREAHIIFHIDGSRFNGNAGCNTISGSYQARDNGRIAFSQTVSTQMMCLSMETENRFKEVIGRADSYSIQGDTLTLNRARMAPIARFVAVYLQ